MTKQELNQWLEQNAVNIEWKLEETLDGGIEAIHFRDKTLPWYQENQNRSTRLEMTALDKIENGDALLRQIRKGLDVEGITRITGYFAKTRSFNPGKSAELQDRVRVQVNE
jgi:hypothetical protein